MAVSVLPSVAKAMLVVFHH